MKILFLLILLISCSEKKTTSFEEFYKKNNSLNSVWEIISIKESNKIKKNKDCYELDLHLTLEAKYNCYYEKNNKSFFKNMKELFFDKKINVTDSCRNSKEINTELNKLKGDLEKLKGKEYCYENVLGQCSYYPLDNINFLKLKNKKQKEFEQIFMYKKVKKEQIVEKEVSISYCLKENLFSLEDEFFDD